MAFARAARRPVGVFIETATSRFSCRNEYSTVASKLESLSQCRSSVLPGNASSVFGYGKFLRGFSSEAPAVDQMSLIKQLRQRTSAPIKDVKASLVECNWDLGKNWLRFLQQLLCVCGCNKMGVIFELTQRLLRRI